MKKQGHWFYLCLCIALFGLTLGCGSTASSTSSSSSATSSYSGIATLSGTATAASNDLASVQSSTSNARLGMLHSQAFSTLGRLALNELSPAAAETEVAIDSGTARLYEIKDDGSFVDTELETEVKNGAYAFKNLADGKKYMVKVYKTGVDSNGNQTLLVVKAYAGIDKGATSASSNVTSESGIVANYIVQNLITEAKSTSISEDKMKEIITAANTAKDEAIKDGSLSKESAVSVMAAKGETVSLNAFIKATPKATEGEKKAAEILAVAPTLVSIAKEAKIEGAANKKTYSTEEARQFIREVFGSAQSQSGSSKGGGKDQIPDFYIFQLADALKAGKTTSIEKMALALHQSLSDKYPILKNTHLTAENLIHIFQTGDSSGIGTKGMNTALKKLYAHYDGTDNDVTGNAGIPSSFLASAKAVFPKDKSKRFSLPLSKTQELTPPQVILFLSISGVFDGKIMPTSYKDTAEGKLAKDPIDGVQFITGMGFSDVKSGKIYITEDTVTPVRANKDGSEVAALNSRINIYGMGFVSGDIKVQLKYPTGKSGETYTYATVAYKKEGASSSRISLATYRASLSIKGAQRYNALQSAAASDPLNEKWEISPFSNGIYVSDFTSGPAIIQVLNGSGEVLAQSTRNIVSIALPSRAWSYPTGSNQVLPIESADGTIQPTVTWADLSATEKMLIPDGYTLVYAIEVGMNARKIDFQGSNFSVPGTWDYPNSNSGSSETSYKWKKVWSSWDTGTFININSFRIPQTLKKTERNTQNNYQTQYEINVRPLLIEKASRQIVWQGAESRTEFTVDVATSWNLALNGQISFPKNFVSRVPKAMNSTENVAGVWKVGLFKMEGLNDSKTAREQVFFSRTVGAREPIVVTTLGTHDQIKASTQSDNFYVLTYTLPSISKASQALLSKSSYQVVLWFEQDSKSSQKEWLTYGNPKSGVDFSNSYSLEMMHTEGGRISIEGAAVVYDRNSSSGVRDFRFLTDKSENQKIDFKVFDWIK